MTSDQPTAFARYLHDVVDAHGEATPAARETTVVVMGAIRLGHLAVTQSDQVVMRPLGLSFSRFRVMFCLWRVGKLTPAGIAETFDISRASTSELLESLEEAGWVERSPNPDDGRSSVIRLTEQGRHLTERAYVGQIEFQQSFLQNLDADEQAQLGSLLSKALTGSIVPPTLD